MSSTQVDLGKQWSWVRENPADWSLSKNTGSLVLTSANGDIQGATNNAENILLQSANTDWTIDSKLVFRRKPKDPQVLARMAACLPTRMMIIPKNWFIVQVRRHDELF